MAEFPTENGVIAYTVFAPEPAAPSSVPTLTLLHNFMSSGQTAWGPLIPALRQHYRVLVPDLPGHGRSQGYPENFNYRQMAYQLAALMQAEGATAGHLAGCSAGGMIAQLLVHHRLVQPKTLTLVSTTYSLNPATTGNYAEITPETFRAGQNWMEATAKLHDPYHYPGYYREILLEGFRRLSPEETIDLSLTALQSWTLPVCLIQGEQDEFFPPFIVEQMAEALPDAELHMVPEQKHALLFRQSSQVRALMMDFLSRHP